MYRTRFRRIALWSLNGIGGDDETFRAGTLRQPAVSHGEFDRVTNGVLIHSLEWLIAVRRRAAAVQNRARSYKNSQKRAETDAKILGNIQSMRAASPVSRQPARPCPSRLPSCRSRQAAGARRRSSWLLTGKRRFRLAEHVGGVSGDEMGSRAHNSGRHANQKEFHRATITRRRCRSSDRRRTDGHGR